MLHDAKSTAESGDADPPTFAEPALPGIQDSEPPNPPSGSDTGSNGLGNTESGGSIPGAWLEWSEAEGEEQESRSEKCRAMGEQRGVVQTLGQPAAGWTKAGGLPGGGKIPLSENTKAVWARQDRAK